MALVDCQRLQSSIWQWLLLTCAILIKGTQASTYCLAGGQLAGVIFGTILGTVAVLAAVFLVVMYLRGSRAKACKDAQLDFIDSGEAPMSQNFHLNASNRDTNPVCTTCTHAQHAREDDEGKRDQHNDRHKASAGHVSKAGEKDKLANGAVGSDLGQTPLRTVQNSANDRSGSEYRTKKKRNSVFSSWWTSHTSSKRRISHSTESLTSVNEVVRIMLKSRDVNGLGFNICGNLRDGIFVKSLSNRGPAKESGAIHEGDRILSVTVNFENIVFEDALTIISYASAYPVTLEVQRADTVAVRRRIGSGNEVTPIGSKANPTSENGSAASKTNRAIFHPLFKSQSIEDVSSFRSPSPAIYSHIFDAIDATLEARRAKTASYASDNSTLVGTPASADTVTSKSKPVLCSLEVIEETPQFLRRSPMAPRKLLDDNQSLDSSASSFDARGIPSGENASTTITVTAEINATTPREEEAIVINDSYASLSYEERLQIIRLSYEDADLSRSTPTRCDSEMTAVIEDPSQKALEDFVKSPSPTLDSLLGSVEETLRRDGHYLTTDPMTCPKSTEHDTQRHCGAKILDDESASAEDDMLSMGESPSSLESSTNDRHIVDHQNLFPMPSLPSKHRLNSLTSPSGSSIGTNSTESDRLSSPEQSKRDSGYENANGAGSAAEDDIEKAQYEKLLYFQRQLAKQHEELARLGIHLPMPAGTIQEPPGGSKHGAYNGQYTSA